jgi:acetolactate synthase-1/3 small subunit
MEYSTISLLVANHFGVLTRVTNLFGRRCLNIRSLTVGETDNPEISRITIVTEGDGESLEQIRKQLLKMEDVRTVGILPETALIGRELLLIKVGGGGRAGEIRSLAEAAGGKVLECGERHAVVELTAAEELTEAFIRRMEPYGILEICRRGVAALQRGAGTIYGNE